MIEGRLADKTIPKTLPFQLVISTLRRKKMLDALMSQDTAKKAAGEKVMKAYSALSTGKK